MADIQVLDQNPLYMGETYRLKFKFSAAYPIGMQCPPSGSGPAHRSLMDDRLMIALAD